MKMPLLKKLPYHPNSDNLYARLKHLPWAAFLDSSFVYNQQGRYDIITAAPYMVLQTDGGITRVSCAKKTLYSRVDPWQRLKTLLTPSIPSMDGIPFPGGALGYFSYDLSRQFQPLTPQCRKTLIPDMMVGIYDWAITVDHLRQQTYLSCCHRHPDSKQQMEMLCALLEQPYHPLEETFQLLDPLSSDISFSQYQHAFNTIKRYLYDGDCYQVNLTHPFTASCQGSAWRAYQTIKAQSPMPYAAFLNFDDFSVLSFSPERFIHVQNQWITATPIKGTCKRHAVAAIDATMAQALRNCEKNRAENLMIVDLLRNDLSKVCMLHSVKTPELFQLNSYAGIHHLSSTIGGYLQEHKHSLDALQCCFPGGSITGAPKIRAMQIIDEVESYPRGIYCGAIGYIGFDGNLDSSIAIRTLVHKNNKLYAYSGGAIVVDSEVEQEYQESFDKIAMILNAVSAY